VPAKFSLSIGPDLFSFEFDNEDGMDTIALDVERHGLVYYEIPLPTVLAAIVRQGSGVFIDVGANTGVYSLLAAAANPVTDVFAFEPVPSIRARLERNLSLNPGLAARISVEPVALSDREGLFVIAEHVNREGFVATSSTLQPEICNSSGTSRDTQVDVTTFDTWIARHPGVRPGLLKVDVEGHEQALFEGSRQSFQAYRPLIIVELLGQAKFEFFAKFLQDYRYQDIALRPSAACLLDEPRFIGDAWNHLFCPQERAWEMARLCNLIGLPLG
jgi:FkbM family methyltransferase